MTLRAIIVEDEETSRQILKNYLDKYCPKVRLLGEAANVEEALVLIRNHELVRRRGPRTYSKSRIRPCVSGR